MPYTRILRLVEQMTIGRAIVKAMIFAGIVSTILFWRMENTTLFWMAVTCVALVFVTFWLLLGYAKRGYDSRLQQLRHDLLLQRTLEKRLAGEDSVDPIERDDVDVLIARIHRNTLDEFPIPAWAILCRDEINEYKQLYQSSPGVDPQSQPMWLILLNNLFLLACPVLLAVAIVLHFKG